MRRLLGLLLLLEARQVHAYCPSYTATSPNNTGKCAVEAASGQNLTVTEWQPLFEKLAQGEALWNGTGVPLGTIAQGCNRPMAPVQVPMQTPCELFKAMAMQESSWRQFCVPDRPSDQVGKASQTLIAVDCGYGVAQITSGMRTTDKPDFDTAKVAADPFYNLAVGAKILASKWRVTQCVGDNQPKVLEHWYSAVWAYNGLSYKNNPNNPTYNSSRGVWNPKVGGSAPYQEKVFGWLERPPTASHWTSVEVAYPSLTEIGTTGAPGKLSEPFCASPTNCAQTRTSHRSQCEKEVPPSEQDAGMSNSEESDGGTPQTQLSTPPLITNALPDSFPEPQQGCHSASGLSVASSMLVFWARRRKTLPSSRKVHSTFA